MDRDPRRRFTAAQAKKIAERSGGLCFKCQKPLGCGFHVHHMIAWAEGGLTEVDNGIALCSECHSSWHAGEKQR